MQIKKSVIVFVLAAAVLAGLLQFGALDFLFENVPGSTSVGQGTTAVSEEIESFDVMADVDEMHASFTVDNNLKDDLEVRMEAEAGGRTESTKSTIRSGESAVLKVVLPQLKAEETVVIRYEVRSKGETLTGDEMRETRRVPSSYLDAWNKGTFETVHESIDYHFKKHGAEVDAENIVDYLKKSVEFRDQIEGDRKKMKSSELEKTYTIKESSGKLPAHKYKHKKDKRYAILTDDDGKILSFGK